MEDKIKENSLLRVNERGDYICSDCWKKTSKEVKEKHSWVEVYTKRGNQYVCRACAKLFIPVDV